MVNKFLSKIFVRNKTDTGCLERFRQTSFNNNNNNNDNNDVHLYSAYLLVIQSALQSVNT